MSLKTPMWTLLDESAAAYEPVRGVAAYMALLVAALEDYGDAMTLSQDDMLICASPEMVAKVGRDEEAATARLKRVVADSDAHVRALRHHLARLADALRHVSDDGKTWQTEWIDVT